MHSNNTVHDHILNTYGNKLNKEKNTQRELLHKPRKRFVTQYNIGTIAHFSRNRLYILMFNLI